MLAPKDHPTSVNTTAAPAIPFNRPTIVGRELHYISEAIHNGYSAGNGDFTKACQSLLEEALGAPRVLLTTSCTAALEMAGILLDLQPGDEFIVPSFTFVSTANAFVLRGARPVFIDIRSDTKNMDEQLLESCITPRTKLIVPVHYAGVGCEMDTIMAVAEHHNLGVVEDNAHGLLATYKGKQLGSFGCLATQSFHETKNFICGEGGALLLNRSDWIERAEIIREKGTNRSRFLRGQVDKYTWVDLGSSYLPSEILAAFLFGQFETRERIQTRRDEIWRRYRDELPDWAERSGVGLPTVPAGCVHPSHLFYLILPTLEARTRLIEHLGQRGILAVFHYQPLHLSEMGRQFGGRSGQCPVAESVSDRLLRLPLYWSITEEEQAEVIEAVRAFEP